jgi:hypothetical protein
VVAQADLRLHPLQFLPHRKASLVSVRCNHNQLHLTSYQLLTVANGVICLISSYQSTVHNKHSITRANIDLSMLVASALYPLLIEQCQQVLYNVFWGMMCFGE